MPIEIQYDLCHTCSSREKLAVPITAIRSDLLLFRLPLTGRDQKGGLPYSRGRRGGRDGCANSREGSGSKTGHRTRWNRRCWKCEVPCQQEEGQQMLQLWPVGTHSYGLQPASYAEEVPYMLLREPSQSRLSKQDALLSISIRRSCECTLERSKCISFRCITA